MILGFVLCLTFIHVHYAGSHNHDFRDFLSSTVATRNYHCGDHPYFIIRTGGNKAVQTHYINVNNKVTIPYGTPLQVECSGADASRLAILKNGVKLQTKNWDKVTISWWTRQPDIQSATYVCTDTETACKQLAIITVTPALDVVSLKLQVYNSEHIIQYGSSLSVTCSGSDAARLALTKNDEKISAVMVSYNTLKWTIKKPDLQISQIVCKDLDTLINNSVIIKIHPLLYIQSNETTPQSILSFTPMRFWYLTYGYSFEIICIGSQAVKLVNPKEKNMEFIGQKFNERSVKLLITNLKIGESVFRCADSIVSDYTTTVLVIITPRMEILSPNVRQSSNKYVIKYGDPVEIFCACTDAKQLSVEDITDEKIYTVNETTVKWIIEKTKINHVYYYSCFTEESSATVRIMADAIPEALGFHCVSHNLEYLNCSWKSPSDRLNFTLFTGNGTTICVKERSREKSRFCVWYYGIDKPSYSNDVKVLSVLIQSCNELGCYNQSFLIDHLSIVRLDPPQSITAHGTSSRGTLLSWRLSHLDFGGERFWSDSDFQHKVQYWYSGIQPLDVNSSLISCSLFDHCKVELDLPCPGQFYQVWVYHKLKRAIGEEFWSEPSSETFRTEGQSDQAAVDASCDMRPEDTAELVTYFVQKFQHEVRLEMRQIRKEVRSLQDKRAIIHAYLGKY